MARTKALNLNTNTRSRSNSRNNALVNLAELKRVNPFYVNLRRTTPQFFLPGGKEKPGSGTVRSMPIALSDKIIAGVKRLNDRDGNRPFVYPSTTVAEMLHRAINRFRVRGDLMIPYTYTDEEYLIATEGITIADFSGPTSIQNYTRYQWQRWVIAQTVTGSPVDLTTEIPAKVLHLLRCEVESFSR